jgi:hypothetical protein
MVGRGQRFQWSGADRQWVSKTVENSKVESRNVGRGGAVADS